MTTSNPGSLWLLHPAALSSVHGAATTTRAAALLAAAAANGATGAAGRVGFFV